MTTVDPAETTAFAFLTMLREAIMNYLEYDEAAPEVFTELRHYTQAEIGRPIGPIPAPARSEESRLICRTLIDSIWTDGSSSDLMYYRARLTELLDLTFQIDDPRWSEMIDALNDALLHS